MKKAILFLYIFCAFLQFSIAQTSPLDSSLVHPLRELGVARGAAGGGALKSFEHTGIENKFLAELDKSAIDIKAVATKSNIANFKVFDYGSYPLLKQMGKIKMDSVLFEAMEVEVKKTTQYYLLVGKHIDVKTGKVEFKVKLVLPTTTGTGNKSSNETTAIVNDATKNTPCNGLNYLTTSDLKFLNRELAALYQKNNLDKATSAQYANEVFSKSLKETVEITQEISERCFSWSNYYLMPSGGVIRINCNHPIVIAAYSRVLYGWVAEEGNEYVEYQADIDNKNKKFRGYKRYARNTDGSLTDTKEYFVEDPVSAGAYTPTGSYPILFVELKGKCTVNVYSKSKNFPQRTELLTLNAVNWNLMSDADITALNALTFTTDETKAINIGINCQNLNIYGQMIFQNLAQRFINKSDEELESYAINLAQNISTDIDADNDFFSDGKFIDANIGGDTYSLFNLYFFDNKQLLTKELLKEAYFKSLAYKYEKTVLIKYFDEGKYDEIIKETEKYYTCNLPGNSSTCWSEFTNSDPIFCEFVTQRSSTAVCTNNYSTNTQTTVYLTVLCFL